MVNIQVCTYKYAGRDICQWNSNQSCTRLVYSQHRLCPPASNTLLPGTDSERKLDPSCSDEVAQYLYLGREVRKSGTNHQRGDNYIILFRIQM